MPDLPGLSWMLLGWLGAVVLVLFVFGLVAYPRLAQWHQKKDNPIGLILAVVAFVAVFFAVLAIVIDIPKENLGKPATSLEPGIYYVVSVGDDLTNKGQASDHAYLVLAESEGNDDVSYQFVRFPRSKVDESQHSLQAGAIYAATKVTTCYTTSACQTLYHFEQILK